MEALAVSSPLTAIASDGDLHQGKGHPRQAGTFGRVLAHYVRETGALSLMDAVRKMTLIPARRLEQTADQFKKKGRISVGADADLTIFDPARVRDRSTFEAPAVPSEGFVHVVVAGVAVVRDGKVVDGVLPGRGVRGAQRSN
jgi:dihydroorotase